MVGSHIHTLREASISCYC